MKYFTAKEMLKKIIPKAAKTLKCLSPYIIL